MNELDLKKVVGELLSDYPAPGSRDVDDVFKDSESLLYQFSKDLRSKYHEDFVYRVEVNQLGNFDAGWTARSSGITGLPSRIPEGLWASAFNYLHGFRNSRSKCAISEIIEHSFNTLLVCQPTVKDDCQFRLTINLEVDKELKIDRRIINALLVEFCRIVKIEATGWSWHRLHVARTENIFSQRKHRTYFTRVQLDWTVEISNELEKVEPLTPKELK